MRRKNKYSRGRSSAVKLGGGGRGGSIKTEPKTKTMTANERAATDDSKIIHHDEDFFAKFNKLSLHETPKERGVSTSNNGKMNSKKKSPRGEEQKKGKKKMNILPAMPMPSLKKAVVVDISKATVSSLNGIGGKPKKKKNPSGKNAVAVAAQDQDENSSPNTMYHGSYNVGVYPEYYYYHHPNHQLYYQGNEVYHQGDESYYYHGQGQVVEEGCYYQDDGGAYYQDEESYGQYDSQYYGYPYHYDTDGMAHHYQYFPTVAAEQYPLNVHAEEYSPDDQE